MSSPPDSEHYSLRQQLRFAAKQTTTVPVPAADLIVLLDYIDELERQAYDAWEESMGDDL